MGFKQESIVFVNPEYEDHIYNGSVDIANHTIGIKISDCIPSIHKPFCTYYEVRYMNSTPNNRRGTIDVVSESTLSKFESGREDISVSSPVQTGDAPTVE